MLQVCHPSILHVAAWYAILAYITPKDISQSKNTPETIKSYPKFHKTAAIQQNVHGSLQIIGFYLTPV